MPRSVLAIFCALLASVGLAKDKHLWQDAEVVNVTASTSEAQELSMSRADDSFPPTSVITHRTTTYLYVLQTDRDVYRVKLCGKPLTGVKAGNHVRFLITGKNEIRITPTDSKKPRTAELLSDK